MLTACQRRSFALILRILLAVWTALLAGPGMSGQTAGRHIEQGQALIRHYNSREYGASAQNWAVLQDRRGMLYVGNNECLLEFDGHNWRRIPGTNGGVFALATDSAGVVYVGGAGDFGYLRTGPDGARRYISLCEQLPDSERNFGVVRSVHLLGDTVFFQSRQYLFLYAGKRLEILPVADSYLRAYALGGQYFLKTAGAGLCRWWGNGLQALPGGAWFKQETIAFLLPYQKTQILVGTQKNGVWAYDPSTGARARPPGFEALQNRLQTEELYHGLQLPGGGYALATLSGGIYLTLPGGSLQRHIHRTLGLHDNTVHHLYLDRQQGLWAAMNHGLDRISMRAPFQYWDAGLGLDAAVLCIKRHRGVLYAGTNLGLYALRPAPTPSAPARFYRVDDALRDQVFALEEAVLPGEQLPRLLLATGSGIYALSAQNRLQGLPGANSAPFYALTVSHRQPGAVYAGGNNGLFRISFSRGAWQTPVRIGASDMLVRSVAEDRNGRIWIGIRNRGWARLEPRPDGRFDAVFFDQLNDRQAVGDHRIFPWGDALLFRSSQFGAFRFDEEKNTFQPLYFSEAQARQKSPAWVAATGPARHAWVWAPSADGAQLEWLREKEPGTWTRVYQPFGILPDVRDLFQGGFYPENEHVTWMGGAMGLYRFDASDMPERRYFQQAFTVLLRRVQVGGDSLLAADWLAQPEKTWALAHQNNSIAFQFAALAFERPENNRYSVFLEGYDRQWSAWTNKTEKEYTNLLPEHTLSAYGRAMPSRKRPSAGILPWRCCRPGTKAGGPICCICRYSGLSCLPWRACSPGSRPGASNANNKSMNNCVRPTN
ncbi:MAG: hypothetical protein IPH12_06515 [Saprospirales bacterium]|nr:hypothetical protein [Saprospirales bacterium]